MKVINKFKKLKLYQIKTSQKLPITIEKAWNFLSNPKNLSLKDLSMGMSSDYMTAIKCGATYVRVGTAIFGLRH